MQRKWGEEAPSENDMASLDYSSDLLSSSTTSASAQPDLRTLVDTSSLGTRGQDGLYEVKDWEFAQAAKGTVSDDFVSRAVQQTGSAKTTSASSLGALGSMFARLTGSRALTESDIAPVLESMKQHLMKKNVAKEISERICEGVGEGLVGKKVGGFQSAYLLRGSFS